MAIHDSLVDLVNVVKAVIASSLVLMAGILLVYRFHVGARDKSAFALASAFVKTMARQDGGTSTFG
ncbi:MAG: hypothetical protein ABIG67_10720 [Pseudomonadota bacterium]